MGWGGKREGSGRKAKGYIRHWLPLPPEIWEVLSIPDIQSLVFEHFSRLTKTKSPASDPGKATSVPGASYSLTRDQQEILEAMLSGEDLFISGGAGVGKSMLIKTFAEKCEDGLILAAPTGVAAQNIAGATVHSIFGLEIKDIYLAEDVREVYSRVHGYFPKQSRKDRKLEVLHNASCVIIDEISMCRGDVFAMIMACIKALRDKGHDIQVIVVGDFFQLPPVLTDRKIFTVKKATGETVKVSQREQYESAYGNDSGYAFLSDDWKFEKCILNQVMRQGDADFAKALNAVRIGDHSGLDYIYRYSSKSPINSAIWICGRNSDADDRNRRELDRLKGKKYEFPIEYRVIDSSEITDSELRDTAFKTAKGDLAVKVGCAVVALVNTYDENGQALFCNGSRGIVKRVEDGEVYVDFGSGAVKVPEYTWEERRYVIDEKTRKLESKVVGVYRKVPLVLGYATTVHKSQGQTLDAINVARNCNFLDGQLYVALSRARDVRRIFIEGRPIPRTSEEVKKFYAASCPER